jgi:RNA polymerase primary sigma factor
MELENINVLSYDKQISHEGSEGGCLVELFESDFEPTDHLLLAKDKLKAMNKALGLLKPMQELIIRVYYGIDGEEPMNLNEIGEQLNISRERVRQIKEKGLLKLKFILNQIGYKDFTF